MKEFKKNIYRTSVEDEIIPIVISDILIDSGPCEVVFSFKVETSIEISIEFDSEFLSVATYIPISGLPLLPNQIGIDSNSIITTNEDSSYMFGINASFYAGIGVDFLSFIRVKIKNSLTLEQLYENDFTRNHTNEIC